MFLEVIEIVLFVLCAFWFFYNAFKGFRVARKTLAKQDGTIQMRCSKCDAVFDVTYAEALQRGLRKEKSIHRSFLGNGSTKVLSASKLMKCHVCGEETWCEYTNIDEVQKRQNEVVLPIIIKHFVIGIIPIFLLMSIIQ